MEATLNERKELIKKQFCEICQFPKNVHYQIAACGKCGFPKSNLKELCKQLGLVCLNCNQSLEGFLKCPTYGEVIQRLKKECAQIHHEDPDYRKLTKLIKDYSDKEFNSQRTTSNITKSDDEAVSELSNMVKKLQIEKDDKFNNIYNKYNPNDQSAFNYSFSHSSGVNDDIIVAIPAAVQ
ncbi:7156_t:CDS:2 [Diversispora eburnea]|uniref:7156_t:CDS:1 n=1 Tax=Diversispora eburnea TaxID=1213867 RepID=A0A9N9BHI8_9GLOM|nr:7156_t:CDS:2 [Diversispora eburnea]